MFINGNDLQFELHILRYIETKLKLNFRDLNAWLKKCQPKFVFVSQYQLTSMCAVKRVCENVLEESVSYNMARNNLFCEAPNFRDIDTFRYEHGTPQSPKWLRA